MVKRSFEILGGSILVIVGIIGWLVPIIPGTVLFCSGILIISPRHGQKLVAWIKASLKKLKKKYRNEKD